MLTRFVMAAPAALLVLVLGLPAVVVLAEDLAPDSAGVRSAEASPDQSEQLVPEPRRIRPRPEVRDRLLHMRAARVIPVTNAEDDPSRQALDTGLSQPTALTSGDFDEDGVADLVRGHSGSNGGAVTLHRGSVDAIFPHSKQARQRRLEGTFSDEPFLSSVRSFETPVSPDFLAAGDFDNDGHWDVAVTAVGETGLYLLAGDGHGGLNPASRVALPGAVTALVAGEINRADGLVDLVVGVSGPERAEIVVFEGPEGALRSEPEIVRVPAAPRALLLARLTGGPWNDLAVGAGDELLIVRGRDRTVVPGEDQRGEAGPPSVDRIALAAAVKALAWGDFAWEPISRRELALLLDDGTLRLLGQPMPTSSWTTIGRRELPTPGRSGVAPISARAALLPLRLTGASTEDLAIFDAPDGRAQLLAGMVREEHDGRFLADPGIVATLDVDQVPTAGLSMRLNADALSDLVLLLPGVVTPFVVPSSPQATIMVDSPADNVIAGDSKCTLREAIENANSDTDTTSGDCVAGAGVDSITFSIAGGGAPAAIAPLSALPAITDAVTIDGTTQGCANPPCIVLDGSGAGFVPAGLRLEAGSSSIRGLVLAGFLGDGSAGTLGFGMFVTSSGNVIEGNYIGTDITGNLDLGNTGAGVRIEDGSNNTVGGTVAGAGNVLSGNEQNGVNISQVAGNASDNHVLGNLIGTDAAGSLAIPNTVRGITVSGAANNVIGGPVVGARNIISGNGGDGVRITGTSAQSNLVLGNYIGTDLTGNVGLGNASVGVRIFESQKTTVGGTVAGARNVISANGSDGVYVGGASSLDTKVLGNFIGTDAGGTHDLGNAFFGVEIDNGGSHTIGGTATGAGNLISGNDLGGVLIELVATPNSVIGNSIGTDVTGTASVANDQMAIWVAEASNSTIGGTSPGARNLISGNSGWGIVIELASDNLVLGNFIGTDVSGTVGLGNTSHGVVIASSTDNTIGGTSADARNVISGNDEDGIAIFGVESSGNIVLGNFVGTDVSGTVDLGNGWNGIELLDGSSNTIGGSAAGAGNVISGNELYNGVLVGGATTNSVLGNFIGTDVSGTVALANGLAGVRVVDASENTIGGASFGERNIISGNTTVGVRIAQAGAHHNTVLGNFIGTDATGTVALGNLLAGVEIEAAANNTIGGTSPGEGNVISGNGDVEGWGVVLEAASDNEIVGNFIGTQADGTSPLGNRLAGVGTASGASNNTIGGTGVTPGRCDGPCNRIGFTRLGGNDGVRILAGSGNGNAILGNSIFSNAELGIDLEGSGVTPNDVGDPDVGANAVQNFPELSLAEATPASATVDGSLNSLASRGFRIEFFANVACDASTHGEGSRYLGFTNVTTDGSGDASFSAVLTGPVSDGEAITATASAAGLITNTSEFSECITATCLSIAVFGHTVFAQDRNTLGWGVPAAARFVKGDLANVAGYVITSTGELVAATSLDISADTPGAGDGLYYVIRPLACGSWQTSAGAEPERDVRLP